MHSFSGGLGRGLSLYVPIPSKMAVLVNKVLTSSIIPSLIKTKKMSTSFPDHCYPYRGLGYMSTDAYTLLLLRLLRTTRT